MADSLQEQLIKNGLARPSREPRRGRRGGGRRQPACEPAPTDLARAWALRERAEAAERARDKAAARARRETRRRVHQIVQGRALNRVDAELVRHFPHRGKIRRIHVDDAQRQALNDGRLAVVYSGGGYVLVTREIAQKIRAFAAEHVALLVDDPAAFADADVPDDLIW